MNKQNDRHKAVAVKTFCHLMLLLAGLCQLGSTVAQDLITRPDAIWVTQRTANSISVAWSAVNDNRLHSYNLRLNGRYAGWTQPGVTNYTYSNITPGIDHTLGVLSVEVPAQIYSDDISITTSTDLPTPEHIRVTGKTATSITIAWTPVNDDRLHSYNLHLNGSYTAWTEPGTTSFTFTNLQADTNYVLGVLSVEVPALVYSDVATVLATTESNLVNAPDQIQVISSSPNSATVSWTSVADPRLQSFNLALDGVYAGWTQPDTTEFTFNGLLPGTQYSFGVRSVEVPGEIYSPLSTISFTTSSGSCKTAEKYQTANINGIDHGFVDAWGNPHALSGINVRSPIRSSNSLRYTQADINMIAAQGFDHIRLPLDWYDFEVTAGVFNTDKLTALDQFIDSAATAGLDVILDPIHLKNDRSANFWGVPAWAWGDVVPETTRVFDELKDHALPYLQMITERYCDTANVIAIDLVNEPREPNRGSLSARNQELVALYGSWVTALRLIDADKPLLLEPFYGSAQVTGNILTALSHNEHLVWSVHDYYAGEGQPINGFSRSGYATVNPRTESWDSVSSYPSNNRISAREGMADHIGFHQNAASAAGLPTHIGEYGIPQGWNGRWNFHCDKTQIYNKLNVPRTAWVWNQDIDGGFGMWHPNSGWVSWVDAIFNPSCQ